MRRVFMEVMVSQVLMFPKRPPALPWIGKTVKRWSEDGQRDANVS